MRTILEYCTNNTRLYVDKTRVIWTILDFYADIGVNTRTSLNYYA